MRRLALSNYSQGPKSRQRCLRGRRRWLQTWAASWWGPSLQICNSWDEGRKSCQLWAWSKVGVTVVLMYSLADVYSWYRICVGLNISNDSIFINIASVLWAFNIGPNKNSDGDFVLPDPHNSVDEGLVVYVFRFHLSTDWNSELSKAALHHFHAPLPQDPQMLHPLSLTWRNFEDYKSSEGTRYNKLQEFFVNVIGKMAVQFPLSFTLVMTHTVWLSLVVLTCTLIRIQ